MITMRPRSQECRLNFGTICILNRASQADPDEGSIKLLKKSHIGYVISQRARKIDKQSRTEINHLQMIPISGKKKLLFIIKILIIYCRKE